MTFVAKRKIILAKIESSYGVDPTPVEGTNPILTKNLRRIIYDGNTVQRDLDLPNLGGDEQINTGPMGEVTFDVELAGAAAAGTAPAYGPLLRACGLSETIVVSTSVTYAPVSTGFESVTIYFNVDGEMQKFTGCRGTVSVRMNKEQIPVYSFRFVGIYNTPTAVAMYDPTYAQEIGKPFNDTNTTTFSVHSQAVVGETFDLDLNNEVNYRNLAGYTGINIVDRDVKGRVVFEKVPIANKNFYSATESHSGSITKDAISVVHGTVAGAICTITAPTAQLQDIQEQESDGIAMHSIPFGAIPTEAGNDELSIAYT